MFRTWSFRSRVPWCCFPPLIISQHNLCDILCKTTCTNTSVLSILRNCWSSGVYKDRFIKWYVHLPSIESRKLSLRYVTSWLPFGNQPSHPWYHSRIAFDQGPGSFSRLDSSALSMEPPSPENDTDFDDYQRGCWTFRRFISWENGESTEGTGWTKRRREEGKKKINGGGQKVIMGID